MVISLFAGCRDSAFLNLKPDQALVIPHTLDDLQALLDNERAMNGEIEGLLPSLGEAGADDYYINPVMFDYMGDMAIRVYQWSDDLNSGGTDVLDWSLPYRCIFYANVVLDGLEDVVPSPAQQTHWNTLRGSALFYRAFAYYHLAQVFCPFYEEPAAETALGLPLRLRADIGEPLSRATLKETYDQIFRDLQEAADLLPATVSVKTRPGKTAVSALLARIYLSMARYPEALQHATAALNGQQELMDYNDLNTALAYPVPVFNPEVIFHSTITYYNTSAYGLTVGYGLSMADTLLYRSYQPDDLRRTVFFPATGSAYFVGSYTGTSYFFGGLAIDELMLIRAECLARQGDAQGAMQQLNDLLVTRWRTGTFHPLVASDAEEALHIVLTERRKELTMRGLRWSDLRRLNREPRFAKTLVRVIQEKTYTLPPDDPRYVYPIPDMVMDLNPAMVQNPK